MSETVDPIEVLLEEHAAAYAIFDALTAAMNAHDRDNATEATTLAELHRTLTFLQTGLETHIRKEEAPLFLPLKAALPADDRLIEEMLAEHDQARMKRDDLRAALEALLGDHDEMRAERDRLAAAMIAGASTAEGLVSAKRAARTVLRTLQVHFQNEEEIVFPLARDLLTAEQLQTAAEAMRRIDAEEAAMTPPMGAPEPRVLNIAAELAKLRASAALERDGRTATTLLNQGPLRVLLVALQAGGRLHEHPAPGRTGIQVFEGTVTLTTGGTAYALAAGQEIVLPAGQLHTVEAHAASALLLHFVHPA